MTDLLDLCKKYYNSQNFYEILKIPTNASEKQVKKAYHKLSLLVHPDRVEDAIKAESTEKFKVLGRIHTILSDKEKRKIYDESGQYNEDSVDYGIHNWADYWKSLFKPITTEDIDQYKENYIGSEAELKDLKEAYLESKGDMDYILESVLFSNCDDEPRLQSMVEKLIEANQVPRYKNFFQEEEKRRQKRRRKWAREAAEAERLDKMLKLQNEDGQPQDLALVVQNRHKARAEQADQFFNSLIEKYSKKPTTSKKKTKKQA